MVFTVLLVIVVVVLGAAGGVVNNLAPCLMINREKYLEMDRIYDKTQQPVHILIYRPKKQRHLLDSPPAVCESRAFVHSRDKSRQMFIKIALDNN